MKRLVFLTGVALALALASAGAGTAEPSGSVRPACADIVDGSAFFTGTLANGGFNTAAPSCKSVRYAMVVYVYDASGNVSTILTGTLHGDNTNTRVGPFNIQTPSADYACIYFISYRGNLDDESDRLLDSNPDSGCPSTLDVNNPNTFVAGGGSPGGGSPFPG
jgi:hypothetical protein